MRGRLVLAAVLAATAVGAAATYVWADRDGPTLAVGLAAPGTLLPGLVEDEPGLLVHRALWTPLTEVTAAGAAVPRLAAAVTSPDQRVWTIRLRPGWRFHDGSEVTAAAVVGTWRANLAEGWRGAGLLAGTLRVRGAGAGATLPGARVVDAHTVEVTLEAPSAELPAVLAAPALQPLPEAALAARDWAGLAARPVGTGPYRLAGAWRPDRGGTLTPYADYAGTAPARPRRIALRVRDAAGQYAALRDGDLDLATAVPGDRHHTLASFAGRYRVWQQPRATYLRFAAGDRRFAEPAVRHAVSLAVDRATLAAGPWDDQVSPLTAFLAPAVPGARADACRSCLFDPPAARAALAEVGGPPPGEVPLWHALGDGAAAAALARQLGAALGATVAARPRSGTAEPADGLVLVDHAAAFASPAAVLVPLLGAAPEVARRCAAAAGAADPATRLREYRLAENVALRDLPLVPLWSRHGHAVWTPDAAPYVDGLLPSAT